MNSDKQKKLATKGWTVGSTSDFLGLTPEESAYIELKLSLSRALKQARVRNKLSQNELAKRLRSSQSRVAKMEAGDKTVSVDLLVRSLLELGSKPKDIARHIRESDRK